MILVNNGKISNIITDQDITVTNIDHIGETLSEIITEHDKKLSRIDSNIKWIYENGGTGGSGGSGGSGGAGNTAAFTAWFNNKLMTEDQSNVFIPDKGKNYPVKVTIRYPGGQTFRVICNYETYNGQIMTMRRDLDNTSEYTYTFSIPVNQNGHIEVSVRNMDTGESIGSLQCDCIAELYTFSQTVTDLNNKTILTDGNEVFVNDINSKGLQFNLYYNLNIVADCEYSIHYSNGESVTGTFNNTSGKIPVKLFEIGSLSTDQDIANCAGTNIITWEVIINRNTGDVVESFKESGSFSFEIIPNQFFISILPTYGRIYSEIKEDNYETFSLSCQLTPIVYNGTQNHNYVFSNIFYDFKKVTDNIPEFDTNKATQIVLTERTASVKIDHQELFENGWFVFRIKAIYDDRMLGVTSDYYREYYLYFSEQNQLDYYNLLKGNWNFDVDTNSSSYIAGKVTGGFSNYSGQSEIKQRQKGNPITISNFPVHDTNHIDATHISFGIKYRPLNLKGQEILKINTIDESRISITLNQNSIKFTSLESPKEIFVPMDDKYHLISIWSRRIKNVNNTSYYETVLYIDGIAESAQQSIFSTNLDVKSIVLGVGNYSINMIDVAYLQLTNDVDQNQQKDLSMMTDLNESVYYYAYRKNVLEDNKAEDKYNELKAFSDFTIDNMQWIEVNSTSLEEGSNSFLKTAIEKSGVPTLVITIDQSTFGWTGHTIDDFRKFIDTSYTSSSDGSQQFIVGAKYYNKTVSAINPSQSFLIEIQGSTTRANKSKNFNLSIVQPTGSDDTYLYTPNFDKNDTHSFLPEETFTLKADVVDSSHSNNTTMGRFINRHTQSFVNQEYANNKYIKNCLEGFPILLFFNTHTPNEVDTNGKMYFMGIYNFNLGRDSYFNLGYYNNNALDLVVSAANSTGDAGMFKVVSVPSNQLTLKTDLTVAEVQDGNSYYDFSQYDDSILFGTNGTACMFGDYLPTNDQITGQQAINQARLKNFVKNVSTAGGYIFKTIGKNFIESFEDFQNLTIPQQAIGLKKLVEGDQIILLNNSKVYFKNANSDYSQITVYDDDNIENTISKDNLKAIYPSIAQEYEYHKNISVNDTYPQSISDATIESYNAVPNFYNQWEKKLGDDGIPYYIRKYVESPDITTGNIQQIIGAVIDEANEKTGRIDYRSIVEYYTICMAFGLVDSVEKNLNIKTFDGGKTFKMAFYDMDTCLGRDNGGNEVKYFAFSDYWSENSDHQITVYPDYYPYKQSGTANDIPIGFDIPSSYLFSIAKYAKSIGLFSEDNVVTPADLWAEWRGTKHNEENNIEGGLYSAEEFVDTYFSKHLNSLNESIFNLNYRFKYLRRQYNSSNIPTALFTDSSRLIGRGIHRVTDWLRGRMRLLDAYFNIGGYTYAIRKRTTTGIDSDNLFTGTWSSSGYNEPKPLVEHTAAASNNPDVKILQDIFSAPTSAEKGIRYSGAVNARFKAGQYSPIIIKSSDSGPIARYLVMDENYDYPISFKPTGSQLYTIGGSSAFTYLDTVVPFIKDGVLNLYSDKLTNISGDNGSMTSLNIELPALDTIKLTSSGYALSNPIELNNTLYPNLTTVDIHGSKIGLNINNSDVQSININDISANIVNITNCNSLVNLFFNSNTKLDTLNVNPLPQESTIFDGSSIGNLTVSGKTENSVVYINNMHNTTQITLGQFKEVEINNCSKLYDADGQITSPGLSTLNFLDSFGPSCVRLTLNNNSITNFNVGNKQLLKLEYLHITDHSLTDLNLSGITPNLKRLYIQGHNIQNINLENCSNLEEVTIGEDCWYLTTLNLNGCSNLKKLTINANFYSEDEDVQKDFIEARRLDHKYLKDIILTDSINLEEINIINAPLAQNFKLPTSIANLKTCYLNLLEVENLSYSKQIVFENADNLYDVNIYTPLIYKLGFDNCDALTELHITSEMLSQFILTGCDALTILYLVAPMLTSINLNGYKLEELTLESKQIEEIDLSEVYNRLSSIILRTNKLTSILGLENCSSLSEFIMDPIESEEEIVDEDTGKVTLKTIYTYNEGMTSLNNLPNNIRQLRIGADNLSYLDLENLSILENLELHTPKLTRYDSEKVSGIILPPQSSSLKSFTSTCFGNGIVIDGYQNLQKVEFTGDHRTGWEILNNSNLVDIIIAPENSSAGFIINNNGFEFLEVSGSVSELEVSGNLNLRIFNLYTDIEGSAIIYSNDNLQTINTGTLDYYNIDIHNNLSLNAINMNESYIGNVKIFDNPAIQSLGFEKIEEEEIGGMKGLWQKLGIFEIYNNDNLQQIRLDQPVIEVLYIHNNDRLENIELILEHKKTDDKGFPQWHTRCGIQTLKLENCNNLNSIIKSTTVTPVIGGDYLNYVEFGDGLINLEKIDITYLTALHSFNIIHEENVEEEVAIEDTWSNRGLTKLSGLKYLDLRNTSDIQIVYLPEQLKTQCEYIDISGSTVLKLTSNLSEDRNIIDLKDYNITTELNFKNSLADIIQLPNIGTSSDQPYIQYHLDNAIRVKSFANNPNLTTVYGNIIITEPEAFKNCQNFTINSGISNTILNPISNELKSVITYYCNTDTSQRSSLDVPWYSGEESTNISFDVTDFTSMFENCKSLTPDDIFYVLRNCNPVSTIDKATGWHTELPEGESLIFKKCFALTYADRVTNMSFPRLLFHNTVGVSNIDNCFANRKSNLELVELASPTLNIDNGFFSPFRKYLKEYNSDYKEDITITDKYGSLLFTCPITEFHQRFKIDSDFLNSYSGDEYVLEKIGNIVLTVDDGINKGDLGGAEDGLFTNLPNLKYIEKVALTYCDISTLSIPSNVTSIDLEIINGKGSNYVSPNNDTAVQGLFARHSKIVNLGTNVRISQADTEYFDFSLIYDDENEIIGFNRNTYYDSSYSTGNVPTLYITDNSLTSFDNIRTFNTIQSAPIEVPKELFQGFNKIINSGEFPYNIFTNCPNRENITNVSGFFIGINYDNSIIEFPKNLFENTPMLNSISYILWDSKFKYSLTSDGFIQTQLQYARGAFGTSNKNAQVGPLMGQIPVRLFKTSLSGGLLDLSYAFCGQTIDPYTNTEPTGSFDFDGFHKGRIKEDGMYLYSALDNVHIDDEIFDSGNSKYIELIDNYYIPYDSLYNGDTYSNWSDEVKSMILCRKQIFNLNCGNHSSGEHLIDRDYRFFCAPDLLQYCRNTNQLNLEGMFAYCGGMNYITDITNTECTKTEDMRGIKGRIPPYLFYGLSSLSGIPSMFKGCRNLSGYDQNISIQNINDGEHSGTISVIGKETYIIPEGLFDYTPDLRNIREAFSYMTWPSSITFNNSFRNLPSVIADKLFYYPTFINTTDYSGESNVLPVLFYNYKIFNTLPLSMRHMIARGYFDELQYYNPEDEETLRVTQTFYNDDSSNDLSSKARIYDSPIDRITGDQQIFIGYNIGDLIFEQNVFNYINRSVRLETYDPQTTKSEYSYPLISYNYYTRWEGQRDITYDDSMPYNNYNPNGDPTPIMSIVVNTENREIKQ